MVAGPIGMRDIVKVGIAAAQLVLSFSDERLYSLECLLGACDLAYTVSAEIGVDLVLQLLRLIGQLDTGFAGDQDAISNLVLLGAALVATGFLPV